MSDFEQMTALAQRFFTLLRTGLHQELMDDFAGQDGPLVDKEEAKFVVRSALEFGRLNANTWSGTWKAAKDTLDDFFIGAPTNISSNVANALLVDSMAFGDSAYVEHLVVVVQRRDLTVDAVGIFNAFLTDILQKLADLDLSMEEDYAETLLSHIVKCLNVLHQLGIPKGYPVGFKLVTFVPDYEEDDKFYSDVLLAFITHGYDLSDGLVSQGNETFNSLVLYHKINGEASDTNEKGSGFKL
jgi:hypothetical protein